MGHFHVLTSWMLSWGIYPNKPCRICCQVRVAVHSAGVNFGDLLMVQGKYQESLPLPFVPGTYYCVSEGHFTYCTLILLYYCVPEGHSSYCTTVSQKDTHPTVLLCPRRTLILLYYCVPEGHSSYCTTVSQKDTHPTVLLCPRRTLILLYYCVPEGHSSYCTTVSQKDTHPTVLLCPRRTLILLYYCVPEGHSSYCTTVSQKGTPSQSNLIKENHSLAVLHAPWNCSDFFFGCHSHAGNEKPLAMASVSTDIVLLNDD